MEKTWKVIFEYTNRYDKDKKVQDTITVEASSSGIALIKATEVFRKNNRKHIYSGGGKTQRPNYRVVSISQEVK